MDISLHSFILVIGLIVIGFIIWDGIKKVRAARANRLDQSLNNYDEVDLLSGNELPSFDELAKFDELEITEELLQDALNEQTDTFDFKQALSKEKLKEPSVNQESKQPEKALATTVDAFEDDGLEHFSAKDDDLDPIDFDTQEPSSDVFEVLAEDDVPSFETEQASAPIIQPEAKPQSQPKPKPQRKSKEELAAKLAEAKAQAQSVDKINKTVAAEDVELDEKESVPVLMEPVELGQKVQTNPPKQHELVLPELIQQTLQDEPVFEEVKPESVTKADKVDPLMAYIEDVQAEPVGEKLSEREAAEEIFVINILKQDGQGLLGKNLHQVFSVCDMRHGEMDIFHRFEKANAQGKIQFSVTNAIEPGTFDLNTMDELVTPGISLFMSLPGPEKPMEAFDAMAEVALVFSRNFSATLHDDTHSDLTPQTLEHYRNRIREFTRKHLSQKK